MRKTGFLVVISCPLAANRRIEIANYTNRLLPGEGAVGCYGDLLKAGRRGDNLTPHHIPSNGFMAAKVLGYSREMGIAIMMEHPLPGKGGRHRQTISYGQSPNLSLLPREALAREISDARAIYRRQGLYTPQIRRSLQQVIQSNKLAWLGVFEKGVNS